jgi:hypothetical protein
MIQGQNKNQSHLSHHNNPHPTSKNRSRSGERNPPNPLSHNHKPHKTSQTMPYIPRSKEATLTALETSTRQCLKAREAYQKTVMHTTPEHTTPEHTITRKRLCKDYLVPLSRQRITNGFLRRIGLLDRVQEARVALLNDDWERCKRVEAEWRWESLLRWVAESGGDFHIELSGYRT